MTAPDKPKRKILLDDEELRQDLPVEPILPETRFLARLVSIPGPSVIVVSASPKGIQFLDFLIEVAEQGIANAYRRVDVARRLTNYLVNESLLLGECAGCRTTLWSTHVEADGPYQLQRVKCSACARVHTVAYLRQQAR